MFPKRIPFICKECKYSAYNIRKYLNHVILNHMADTKKKKLPSNQPAKSKKQTRSQLKKKRKKSKIITFNPSTLLHTHGEPTLPYINQSYSEMVSSPERRDSLSTIKLRKFSLNSTPEMLKVKTELVENDSPVDAFSWPNTKKFLSSTAQECKVADEMQEGCSALENQSEERTVKRRKSNRVIKPVKLYLSNKSCGTLNPSNLQTKTIKLKNSYVKSHTKKHSISAEKEGSFFDNSSQTGICETTSSNNSKTIHTNDRIIDPAARTIDSHFSNLEQHLKRAKKSINNRSYKQKSCATENQSMDNAEKSIDHSVYKESILSDIFSFIQPENLDGCAQTVPEEKLPSVASTSSETAIVPYVSAKTASASNIQTQTEPWAVACVKVNNSLINAQKRCSSGEDEELKIVSVESCSQDLSKGLSPGEVVYDNRLCVLNTAPSEKMQTLLTSGVVTMPSTFDPALISDEVSDTLSKSFLEFPYPPHRRLKQLSSTLNLSVKQLKNWFANARLQNGVSWDPDEIHDAWSFLRDDD